MEEEEGSMSRRQRGIMLGVNRFNRRRYDLKRVQRLRDDYKPLDGPPPLVDNPHCKYIDLKGYKPPELYAVGYENMDPAILAYMPQCLRSRSAPTSGTIPPPPTMSAIIAATIGYQAQVKGGTVPNKDLGKSTETLVENLKVEDINISN